MANEKGRCRDCEKAVHLSLVYRTYADGSLLCTDCAFRKGQMRGANTWGK